MFGAEDSIIAGGDSNNPFGDDTNGENPFGESEAPTGIIIFLKISNILNIVLHVQ